MPPALRLGRRRLYQASMYSMTAVLAASLLLKRSWWYISVFRCEKKFSATELSQHTPTAPMDWVMPFPPHHFWNSSEVYCDPRSELSRIRLNSDYAEKNVKPRLGSLRLWFGGHGPVPRLNVSA